jgi:hypothetical protein
MADVAGRAMQTLGAGISTLGRLSRLVRERRRADGKRNLGRRPGLTCRARRSTAELRQVVAEQWLVAGVQARIQGLPPLEQ